MVDKRKKQRKNTRFISEEDICAVLERYSAETLVRVAAEIGDNPGVNLDWSELVKNTKTGISSAREYQMVWRCLAYGDELMDSIEDGAQPLDDESDLECEVEAFPPVSAEEKSEAAACVKVLASSLRCERNLPADSLIEAPMIIQVPNKQPFQSDPEYVTVPVFLPNPHGSRSSVPRSSRQRWSAEEDEQLIAAVEIYGESNWTNIAKEVSIGGRTPSQLSQRWCNLKKKNATSDNGGNGPHLSDVQEATRLAMSFAIDGLKSKFQ